MPDEDKPKTEPKPSTIKYHYIKSNSFRVMHVDGAIGGPTPQGFVQVAIFSERFPIPVLSVHEQVNGVAQGIPSEVVSRDGIVREVESDLIMTVAAAKALSEWLLRAAKTTEDAAQTPNVKP